MIRGGRFRSRRRTRSRAAATTAAKAAPAAMSQRCERPCSAGEVAPAGTAALGALVRERAATRERVGGRTSARTRAVASGAAGGITWPETAADPAEATLADAPARASTRADDVPSRGVAAGATACVASTAGFSTPAEAACCDSADVSTLLATGAASAGAATPGVTGAGFAAGPVSADSDAVVATVGSTGEGVGSTRGGSKPKGSTYPCGSAETRTPKYTKDSPPAVPTTEPSETAAPRLTAIDPN